MKFVGTLKTAIAQFKPDVVHAHYATSYGLIGALSGFHPFVISAWGTDVMKFPQKNFINKANAITVNTVHGNEDSIANIVARLNPQLESMEGAAFFYACHKLHVPCIQIRAVSNYVEKRNRDNWDIPLAIKNLNNFALELISEL